MTLKDALRCGFSLLNVASLTAPKVGAQTRTMVVCLGGWGWDWKGSRIRMWGTLAVNRWIQDHWFRRPPLSFSWICIANCCSVTLGFFWSQKRLEGGIEMEEGQRWWWREGGSRVPTISRPSTLCNLTPLPNKKKPFASLLLHQFLSRDPTTAASAVSTDLSSVLGRAQQAHCSVGRRLGQLYSS